MAGFYKGLQPSLLRVVPATALTLVIYENMQHFLIGASDARRRRKATEQAAAAMDKT